MQSRKAVFVLMSADHGSMIVNRFDYKAVGPDSAVGVGIELLENSKYQQQEVDCIAGLLEMRRRYYGEGVVAIDGGANIGVCTVDWARGMTGWGTVIAIEPQERVFYALAGNITINNCANACAIHAALGSEEGVINVPVPDYARPANFGGLSLLPNSAECGQDLKDAPQQPVRLMTIDSMGLERLDLIKIDAEGMDLDVLRGAQKTIEALHPVIQIEHHMIDMDAFKKVIASLGYEWFFFGGNIIAAHRLDKCLDHIRHLHKMLAREALEAAA